MATESDFVYALRRYDRDPHLSWFVGGHDEAASSVPFTLNGKVAPTLFVRFATTRDAALWQGWKDETDAIKKSLEATKVVETQADEIVPSVKPGNKSSKKSSSKSTKRGRPSRKK